MAIPFWPFSLPPLQGLASSAGSRSLHPVSQETQFDDGPARVRRRTLFVTTPLTMQLRLTPAQFVTFTLTGLEMTAVEISADRAEGTIAWPDGRQINVPTGPNAFFNRDSYPGLFS